MNLKSIITILLLSTCFPSSQAIANSDSVKIASISSFNECFDFKPICMDSIRFTYTNGKDYVLNKKAYYVKHPKYERNILAYTDRYRKGVRREPTQYYYLGSNNRVGYSGDKIDYENLVRSRFPRYPSAEETLYVVKNLEAYKNVRVGDVVIGPTPEIEHSQGEEAEIASTRESIIREISEEDSIKTSLISKKNYPWAWLIDIFIFLGIFLYVKYKKPELYEKIKSLFKR